MSTIPPQPGGDQPRRAFGSALLRSVTGGAIAGAIVGLGMSFVLPWLGSITVVDATTIVNLALQSLFLLSWYLVPLGAAYGLAAGTVAGLSYPFIRRLPSGVASAIIHAVLGGALVSALWFVSSELPVTLLDPGYLGIHILNAGVLGAAFALVTIPAARYLVYRRTPAA